MRIKSIFAAMFAVAVFWTSAFAGQEMMKRQEPTMTGAPTMKKAEPMMKKSVRKSGVKKKRVTKKSKRKAVRRSVAK